MNKGKEYTEKYAQQIGFEKEITHINSVNGWSTASFVSSLIALVCCPFLIFGVVMGTLGIIFAGISRSRLGSFDGLSMAGLVMGIFGILLGMASIIALVLLLSFAAGI